MGFRCPIHPEELPFTDEESYRLHLKESVHTKVFLKSFPDILEWNEKRANNPPLVDLGDEKVTVACPYEPHKLYVKREYLEAIAHLEVTPDSEIYFTEDTKPAPMRWTKLGDSAEGSLQRQEHVLKAHNRCRDRALANDSDYLMMVETDLLPPPDAYRRLKTLCERYGADIAYLPYTWHYISPIRGVLFTHLAHPEKEPLLIAWHGSYPMFTTIYLRDFLVQGYPAQVSACGLGCTLISRKVLEKVPFEIDWNNVIRWCTDGALGKRIEQYGWKVLADNRVLVQHLCCLNCYLEYKREELASHKVEPFLRVHSKAQHFFVEEV